MNIIIVCSNIEVLYLQKIILSWYVLVKNFRHIFWRSSLLPILNIITILYDMKFGKLFLQKMLSELNKPAFKS